MKTEKLGGEQFVPTTPGGPSDGVERVKDPIKAYEMGHAMNMYYSMAANALKLGKEDLAKKLIEQGDAAGGIAEKKFNEREQAVNELIAEVAEKLFPVVVLGGRANVRRGGQLNGESLGKVFGNAETSDLLV